MGDEIFSYVGTWAVEEPEVYPGLKGDMGLVLSEWTCIPHPSATPKQTRAVELGHAAESSMACGA